MDWAVWDIIVGSAWIRRLGILLVHLDMAVDWAVLNLVGSFCVGVFVAWHLECCKLGGLFIWFYELDSLGSCWFIWWRIWCVFEDWEA